MNNTFWGAEHYSFGGTERGVLCNAFKEKEVLPLVKKEALASVGKLMHYCAYSHNEGKVLAATLIIESIE